MPLAKWWRGLLSKIRAMAAPGGFICDSCRYDHPRSCRNPARPNASACDDYKKR